MKKTITSIALCLTAIYAFAQEKGDNYLGINFGVDKYKSVFDDRNQESKVNTYGLNYSKFINENKRINIVASYSNSTIILKNSTNISNLKTKVYSLGIGYGMLFPILKNFYAEFSPGFLYSHGKDDTDNIENTKPFNAYQQSNSYFLNLSGGVVWVPFKHFGLSANLASLRFGYSKQIFENTTAGEESISTSRLFGISNQGSLQNQSFTVFYKFK